MKKTKIDSVEGNGNASERDRQPEPLMSEEQIDALGDDDLVDDAAGAVAEEIDPRDAQIAALTEERDALRDQTLRLRAEFDNARKRLAREAERTSRAAVERVFVEWLPVVDNLELALQHAPDRSDSLAQGVELVLKQVCDVLSRNGVEPIPAVGEVFSPHFHEAMTHAESEDVPENCVAMEFQRGYRMGDQVLRPTKVAVSRGKPSDSASENA